MSESNLSLHIDPISHDPIPIDRLVTIHMSNHHTEYFDIEHLHTWFITRGEPINPLTNIGFTKGQIQDIRNSYLKLSKTLPWFLHPKPDEKKEEEQLLKEEEKHKLRNYFIDISGDPSKIEQLRDLLYSQSENIHNDTFILNPIRIIHHELIQGLTPLFNAILNDNLYAVQELLIFNPDLNYIDPKNKYKAIDLAILSTKQNSTAILQHLLFYGAATNITVANNKYCYELTDDPSKLELIYTFTS